MPTNSSGRSHIEPTKGVNRWIIRKLEADEQKCLQTQVDDAKLRPEKEVGNHKEEKCTLKTE